MPDSSDRSLPARLAEALGGAYTIEGEIGRGGMGVVYRARDERLQRRVAIKVLPPELAFQAEIRERFTREAQTAARLSHPNIVPIHTVGEGNGLVYFVMGYVDGESVGGRIKRRGRLPVEEVRRIMRETADALGAAHAVGIVHRDVKPDNILLEGTRGRVMVTDFGIAKALSGASSATLTGAGVAIGTPSFMSPEQAAGERDIDGRSDLYSLGIVSYQMLTAELPFSAPTVAGILMKQITEPAPMVTAKRSDVPEDLALAIARCLEKDPENRWPTADALRRALESRSVIGYQPTGLGWRAATRPTRGGARPGGPASSSDPLTSRRPVTRGARDDLRDLGRELRRDVGGRPLPARRSSSPAAARYRRGQEDSGELPVPDTGEPRIVQKVRAQFARWAAVSGGLFMVNAATGLDTPWFLFPAAGMGIGLLNGYARLWQAGYSWRDVLSRPPAPDAVETSIGMKAGKLPRQVPAPKADEYGSYYPQVLQVHGDRLAILKAADRLDPSERKLIPELTEAVDDLYKRVLDLGRTLHALDTEMRPEALTQLDMRIVEVEHEAENDERDRRLNLLRRQRQTFADLQSRREQVAGQFESCVLTMQNMRLDLIKLRHAGVAETLNEFTQVTQKAKALSRDVDNAIAAAGEIRAAVR
ncbi:MAG: protein kinase [Gemmatimonadota bacterium]|nr:protein kinase [Gemmatimonadota bacterium]